MEAARADAETRAVEKESALKLAAERKSKIDVLERQISQLDMKLSLSKRELNRAEGQINLITELVLRGGGL